MRLSVRRPGALVLMAALAFVLRGGVAHAQDSSLTVRIGLTYAPGTKPGVLVLPVNGERGDSVRAMLQRDLDFGDRVNVIGGDAVAMDSMSDGSRGQYNYPLYSRLGAVAMVQATMTATGLHVAVHDVRTQKVERVKDFPLSAIDADSRLAAAGARDRRRRRVLGLGSSRGCLVAHSLLVRRPDLADRQRRRQRRVTHRRGPAGVLSGLAPEGDIASRTPS